MTSQPKPVRSDNATGLGLARGGCQPIKCVLVLWVGLSLLGAAQSSPASELAAMLGVAVVVSDASGKPDEETEHITMRRDVDEPWVWEAIGQFESDPSSANTDVVFQLLDEVLADESSHPPGVVVTILDAIARNHVEAGRPYINEFARSWSRRQDGVHIVHSAALALGRLGGGDSLRELEKIAGDGPTEVLPTVAVALGVLQEPRSVPLLEELAAHPESDVRRFAISALANYCVDSSEPIAISAISDLDHWVRTSGTSWLAQCGTLDHAPLLSTLITDPDEFVRGHALKGLLRFKSREGCRQVHALLSDESATVRDMARKYRDLCGTPSS